MKNKAAPACLALLLAFGLQPVCAQGETLAELARERGELRFALCTGPAGTLRDECGTLDEETVWTLHGDGSASLDAAEDVQSFKAEGRWQERSGAVAIAIQADDRCEYRAPFLEAVVGMVKPQTVRFASPVLGMDAPRSFEALFAFENSLTFNACTKADYLTPADECSETNPRHRFTFSKDGTGLYVKPTQREPVKFSWSWRSGTVEARVRMDLRGRFFKDRYLELESPWKGRRATLRFQLLGQDGGPEPKPAGVLPPLVSGSAGY